MTKVKEWLWCWNAPCSTRSHHLLGVLLGLCMLLTGALMSVYIGTLADVTHAPLTVWTGVSDVVLGAGAAPLFSHARKLWMVMSGGR